MCYSDVITSLGRISTVMMVLDTSQEMTPVQLEGVRRSSRKNLTAKRALYTPEAEAPRRMKVRKTVDTHKHLPITSFIYLVYMLTFSC